MINYFEYELVLKLPKDKPPFIGLLFSSATDAEKLNEDLVLEHKNKSYKILLEPLKGVISLRLICEEIVTVRFYNNIKCNPEKLSSWLYLTKNVKRFNFSHVARDYKIYDKLVVAKPKYKLFVLSIESVKLITEDK